MVCKKLPKAFDFLWICIFIFQSCHGLEEAMIWLLHWKLFGDLHYWCFLIGTMTFSLVIPHFSLANVSRVCGMNNKNVIEMMNEKKCHYYVFGSLFQSCHGWKPYGYYIESFLGTYIYWCFLTCMIESYNFPFLSYNCVCGLWHKQQTCNINEKSSHRWWVRE